MHNCPLKENQGPKIAYLVIFKLKLTSLFLILFFQRISPILKIALENPQIYLIISEESKFVEILYFASKLNLNNLQ